MRPVIEMLGVDTVYEGEKNATLKEVDLRIWPGDLVCVLGPNGAGKTTLLETINGILPYKRGMVTVLDEDVCTRGPKVRRQVGYMLQEHTFPESTPYLVKDVIIMGRFGRIGLFRRPNETDRSAARRAAEYMEIFHLWDRPIGKLSGGQVQKVLLARTLAKEPRILLMDEPYSNLDYRATEEISSKICELHRTRNLTTLMVIHELNHIPPDCNRIVLLKDGKVLGDAPPQKMLSSSLFRHAFSEG
ncbi:MAG: ABC transporter ATP-binding protein [Euryarchaeota archaeon]|nr:ABC transporter ATP-binding protein [Euryarchaeota archaeon]